VIDRLSNGPQPLKEGEGIALWGYLAGFAGCPQNGASVRRIGVSAPAFFLFSYSATARLLIHGPFTSEALDLAVALSANTKLPETNG
jgi:hypothetical protein